MFKGLILATFAMLGLLSTMSAISSDEVTKSSDLDATMHVEKLVLGSGCFWGHHTTRDQTINRIQNV